MTRRECEDKLLAMAEQMRDVFLEYNPSGEQMAVTIGGNGYISIRDTYFTGVERDIVLDVHDRIFESVNITRFSDGHIRHGELPNLTVV